jgi:2-C-methyl-D-erythritol 4-phosphate cytidylyltransferase/2-C-methyl-D-erythritol 2,4-cyclodiphosphate synthase
LSQPSHHNIPMHTWTLLLASGQGTRMIGQRGRKQFLSWKDRPLYWHSVLALASVPSLHGLIVTFPPEETETRQKEMAELQVRDGVGLEFVVCPGGASRQESVANALRRLPPCCSHVLIHDAARPFAHSALFSTIIDALAAGASAAVPALPVTDTIKELGPHRVQTLDRSRLYAAQTPQGFVRTLLDQAHAQAAEQGWEGTDDASLLERAGHPVQLVPGQTENIKITTDKDLDMLQEDAPQEVRPCIGWGYDVHRFGPGRPLKLGGIPITGGLEVQAHSDGDVLLHALIDAILGCLGLGDIGDHFPDSEASLENISSGVLLAETLDIAARHGLHIDHLDATVIAQTPKLGPWKGQIRTNLQNLLALSPAQVNIKATTEEGLGFTGSRQGIKAVAQIIGHRTVLNKGG